MKSKQFSPEHKAFYQNLKKSLQNGSNWVTGSTNRTTDIVVLDLRKNIELFKIVTPEDVDNVSIWHSKLKKIYTLAWYKADYTLVYVDENYNEIRRLTISLK